MKKVLLIFVLFLVIMSCGSNTKKLTGIYELRELNVDGLDKFTNPIFLEFKDDQTFALSLVNGDFLGFYSLNGSVLKLSSESGGRFNASWKITDYKDRLLLEGLDEGFTVTKMIFNKIAVVPSFEEFEAKILGEWQIYKTRNNGKMERVTDTYMTIGQSAYAIRLKNDTIEQGLAVINTRHRRIIFENEDMKWKAWFYGDELRLTNPNNGFQYDLRKID
ncbi:MAG: hypothetical protein CMB80_34130 [Flammeovirgaceae bacterium]|nr:hypothetical protein [Flammeovirgaceae bacterium]